MLNITVKVNSVDVTSRVQSQSLQIVSNLNQRKDSCAFMVRKTNTQTFAPEVNQEVEVFDGLVKIFGGVIVGVTQSVLIADYLEYEVQCSDYSHFMDRKLVLERFENETVGDIIAYLISVYAPDFTDANVVGDFTVASVAFNRITMSECIQKLADQIGYSWYVDYDRDIHFFPKSTELAPFSLTDTSENFLWKSLTIDRDLTQLRNAVYVEGGEAVGNTRTETFIASSNADERTVFRLANKFATKPTVEVNGVAQTVGIDYLDLDASFDCMWSFQEKYIRFTAGNEPAATNIIEVTGDPLFPVIVKILSGISITQYGIYEFVIRDRSIRSRDEARDRALAELQAYQNGVIEGTFQTYESGLRAGQVITVSSPIRDVNENFLIQSVRFKSRSNEQGLWVVSLATLRTIGIIDFLRDLLKNKEVRENEAETLLSYLQFTDEAQVTDVLTFPVETTEPPYIWLSDNPADDASVIAASGGRPPIIWNRFTWAA